MWRKLSGKTFKRQKNFVKMRNKFIENQKIFQFAYSYSYPEIYTFVEKRGKGIRKEFHVKFKTWKDKKNNLWKHLTNLNPRLFLLHLLHRHLGRCRKNWQRNRISRRKSKLPKNKKKWKEKKAWNNKDVEKLQRKTKS